MTQDTPKKSRPLLEFGPLILFFITNYVAGIFYGTAVLVAATILALGLSWHLDKRIPLVPAFGCVAVVFFWDIDLGHRR